MRKMYYLMLMLLISTVSMNAQVKIGSSTLEPHTGAVLDLKNTGVNKGLLLPNVALNSDLTDFVLDTDGTYTKENATGMMVYNTTDSKVYVWDGNKWSLISGTAITEISVIGISFNPTSLALSVGGSAQTLTAIFNPTNATNQSLTWESDNNAVATVLDGVVTPVAPGTVNITATTGNGKTASCSVTVSLPTILVTEITITGGTTIEPGQTLQLSAEITPSNATNKTVSWTVTSVAYAGISASGLLSVDSELAGGTVTVTATAKDGSGKSVSKVITVNAVTPPADPIAASIRNSTFVTTSTAFTGGLGTSASPYTNYCPDNSVVLGTVSGYTIKSAPGASAVTSNSVTYNTIGDYQFIVKDSQNKERTMYVKVVSTANCSGDFNSNKANWVASTNPTVVTTKYGPKETGGYGYQVCADQRSYFDITLKSGYEVTRISKTKGASSYNDDGTFSVTGNKVSLTVPLYMVGYNTYFFIEIRNTSTGAIGTIRVDFDSCGGGVS